MIVQILLSLLFGGMLSLYFRCLVLVAASAVLLLVTCVSEVANEIPAWWVFLSSTANLAALQAGYVGGALIQHRS